MKKLLVISILLISIIGCAGHDKVSPVLEEPKLSFDSDLFGQSPDIIPADDIYRLTDEQQQSFFDYFENPSRRKIPAHERIYEYLKVVTDKFSYRGETYTATVSLQEASGNCLSLAILTTAIANLANVETGYQLVDSTPVFEPRDGIIFKGLHVRTKLYDPVWKTENNTGFLRRPGFQIDYFPTGTERFVGNLSEAEYIAMYYSNIAADAMVKEDYSSAYWLLRKSLELTPDNAAAINSLAVVFLRAGDAGKAEEIYKYGIEHLDKKISLLRNYRILLEQQNRLEEAEEITSMLAQLDDPSPYDWIQAGGDAYDEGDYKSAITFYEKAIEIAPYLHETYSGLAKAYYQMGDKASAQRELRKALEHSYRVTNKTMYEAKLMALNNEL